MEQLSKQELEEALPPITSIISKCEKAQVKLMEGTAQHSLLRNRIKALRVAENLIHQALKNLNPQDNRGTT
ncbi:hypothetical protein [Paenibacillus daejeonensis]|uniref:hypothetical protein n=1 Tax=Paenibacillus daejeonensis TaxID=135193 RepID=UPI000371E054|nr:hypothetical protein [Paenibacillus daejeonensis]